jgi:hypothetical protein
VQIDGLASREEIRVLPVGQDEFCAWEGAFSRDDGLL